MTSEDTGAYGRDIGVTLPDLLNEVQSNIDLCSNYDCHSLVTDSSIYLFTTVPHFQVSNIFFLDFLELSIRGFSHHMV